MKRITLLAVFFTVTVHLEAQNPSFANGDGGFENCWIRVTPHPSTGIAPFDDFRETFFLTTLNSLHELTDEQGMAPLTAFRLQDADAYQGSSLKLVSNNMTVGMKTIFLPGATGTLEIEIDIDAENGGNCTVGEPFTFRPTAIKGVRQYTPKGGDAAAIEVQLKKGDLLIAKGKERITATDATWTPFNVPIGYYYDDIIPDLIIVIFSASDGYDFTDMITLMNCTGVVGSTLCLDDIEFEYGDIEIGVKEMFDPAIKLSIYPNPSKERVSLQIGKETSGTVVVYDYLIRKIGEYSINGTQIDINIQDYAAGSYLINVIENGKVITTGRFGKE